MLKKVYDIFAMACREATLLMEKGLEGKLSSYEKVQLKFHLAICEGCKRYNKQTALLHSVLKPTISPNPTDFSSFKLSPEAKARISKAIDENKK